MKRKHPVEIKETISFHCELCDYETSKKIELKRHTKSHSYTFENNACKCNECDFTGKNAWTLQSHNGKVHSKNFKCGLCDFPAKDLETLNLHLITCEIYECNKCEHVAKKISSIKKHMHISKDCNSSTIHHVKIDRNDNEEADNKEYEQIELFEKENLQKQTYRMKFTA